eukprot:2260329-Amphidinium_carterae.1
MLLFVRHSDTAAIVPPLDVLPRHSFCYPPFYPPRAANLPFASLTSPHSYLAFLCAHQPTAAAPQARTKPPTMSDPEAWPARVVHNVQHEHGH